MLSELRQLIEALRREVGQFKPQRETTQGKFDAAFSSHDKAFKSPWLIRADTESDSPPEDFETGHAHVSGLHYDVSKLAKGVSAEDRAHKNHPLAKSLDDVLQHAQGSLDASKVIAARGQHHLAISEHLSTALSYLHGALKRIGKSHPKLKHKPQRDW